MITDFDSSLARFLRPHAERSAEPHEDREPEKRGQPPAPEPTHEPAERIDLSRWAPEAVETWRRSEKVTEERAGVPPAMLGHAPPAHTIATLPGHWRPPVTPERMREEHSYDALVVNGKLMYQQCPPVDTEGAVYADSKDGQRLVRGISEAQAQRMILAAEWAGTTPHEAARMLEVTPARVARKKAGRRHRKGA